MPDILIPELLNIHEGQLAFYRSETLPSNKGTLLFIHGLGSSSRDWHAQIRHFKSQYRVFTLDLRGHGRSSRNWRNYGIRFFADDVAQVLRDQANEAVHVIGVSMGGMVCYELALRYPELVRSIVPVNVLPEFRKLSLRKKIVFGSRLLALNLFGMRPVAKSMSLRLFPDPDQIALRKAFVERWSENDPGIYSKCLLALSRWSVADQLDRINIPALVITGDRDYVSPETHLDFLRDLPKADLKVVRNSGHATPVDQPEQFNQFLSEFLDSFKEPG